MGFLICKRKFFSFQFPFGKSKLRELRGHKIVQCHFLFWPFSVLISVHISVNIYIYMTIGIEFLPQTQLCYKDIERRKEERVCGKNSIPLLLIKHILKSF